MVGFGLAAELGLQHHVEREKRCLTFRRKFLQAIEPLGPKIHGDEGQVLAHTANLSFPGLSAEEAMVRLKNHVAVSNGSACTSASYQPSHVLKAMGLEKDEVVGAMRFSWSHLTPEPDWAGVVAQLRK